MSLKLKTNEAFTELVKEMYVWDKERILNYAEKKSLSFHQAIYEIVRIPKALRDGKIDAIVDKEFHSSNRPNVATCG